MSQPLLAGGEFALVKEHLEAIGSKPPLMRGPLVTDRVLYFMYADLAVLERNEPDLHYFAPLALETAARGGHTLFQAVAKRALGLLCCLTGDYAAAEEHLHQALEMFEGLGTRWQVGRTLVELAELTTACTDYAQARAYYMKATKAFDEMGAEPAKVRAQTALKALGEIG